MKKAFGIIALGVLLGILVYFGAGLLAFGDPIGPNTPMTVKVYSYSSTGNLQSSSGKAWSALNYAECTADYPGYATAPAGRLVDSTGYVLQGTSDPLRTGNAYEFPSTVYFQPGMVGNALFTTSKPVQHPECQSLIRAWASKAGIELTRVVYVDVNQTIVKTVYSNQTIYVCPDSSFTADPAKCPVIPVGSNTPDVEPVPVTKELTVFHRIAEWFKELFSA